MEHRTIRANGIDMHVVEHGEGPLVVLLHGFPEGWASWRHQLPVLGDAGYRVVAPDERGYGGTAAPGDPAVYTQLHLVGDVVGLIAALGGGPAVVVGHDWGAPVAWHTALLRPDLVRAVVATIPYSPPGDLDLLSVLDAILGPHHYQRYFQQPGVAEAEMDADVRRTILQFYGALSGHDGNPHDLVLGAGRSLLEALPAVDAPPPWMTVEYFEHLVGEFGRTGFGGGLNWYRNAERNQQLLRPWAMQPITVPGAVVVGELDVVLRWPGMRDLLDAQPMLVPQWLGSLVIPGCGHWTQEERPDEVNAFLLDVLAKVG